MLASSGSRPLEHSGGPLPVPAGRTADRVIAGPRPPARPPRRVRSTALGLGLLALVTACSGARDDLGPAGVQPAGDLPADRAIEGLPRESGGPAVPDPARAPALRVRETVRLRPLTGAGSMNRTDQRWDVSGADLGHMFMHEGRMAMVFGDIFTEGRLRGEWFSNAMAWLDDKDPDDGLTFAEMVTGEDGRAREILPSKKVDWEEMTVLSTGGISLEGRILLHFVSIRHWYHPGDCVANHGGLAASTDDGETFRPVRLWSEDSGFLQAALVEPGDDHLYLLGTPCGRSGAIRLARAPVDRVLQTGAYEYWDGGQWQPDPDRATPVVPGPAGELSVQWSSHYQRWVMVYLERQSGIVLRTARELTGPWGPPRTVVPKSAQPRAYAPFLVPTAMDGPDLYFTLSLWKPYNVFLMRASLEPVAAGTAAGSPPAP